MPRVGEAVRQHGVMIDDEEVLAGGNMGGATRVGATVRRGAGPWSPTIQRLLRHLRANGVDWVPSPLGTDDQGRDNVSFLPGLVPAYPLPEWIWADDVLADAGRHLAQLHRASATFDATGAVWQLEPRSPAEVICHNDFAPYNMVFTDGHLSGVIDWDTAAPGPRIWDLAYLAYRLVPLTEPSNVEADPVDPSLHAARLALLCDAYAGAPRPTPAASPAGHSPSAPANPADNPRTPAASPAASPSSAEASPAEACPADVRRAMARPTGVNATDLRPAETDPAAAVRLPRLRPADVLPVVVDRLRALADFTEARADEGHEHLRSHVELYRRDAAWVARG